MKLSKHPEAIRSRRRHRTAEGRLAYNVYMRFYMRAYRKAKRDER